MLNVDVSGGHGSMNIHSRYQHNCLKSLINSKNRDDIENNADLNIGDVNCGICLINSHNLSQFNESSYFNDLDWCVENGDVSGGHYFMNSHTPSKGNDQNFIDSTKKTDEIPPIYLKLNILG